MEKKKICATCSYRWCGQVSEKIKFTRWYCRYDNKRVSIGTDAQLAVAKGCKKWKEGKV